MRRRRAADEADGFWRVGIWVVFWEKSGGVYKARCGGKRKLEILSERETEIAGQCSERG